MFGANPERLKNGVRWSHPSSIVSGVTSKTKTQVLVTLRRFLLYFYPLQIEYTCTQRHQQKQKTKTSFIFFFNKKKTFLHKPYCQPAHRTNPPFSAQDPYNYKKELKKLPSVNNGNGIVRHANAVHPNKHHNFVSPL